MTAFSLIISTIVLAVTPKLSPPVIPTPVTPPTPSSPGDAKDWIKKQLHSLADLLKSLAEKATAALPGIISSIVSWLLKTAATATVWLAEHLWALVFGVVVIVLTFVKERFQNK